jgi:hypothetical protein
MTLNAEQPEEREIALVISSHEPQEILDRIASLHAVAGYQLIPRDSVKNHDLYFDTQDRALDPQKLALRVRETGPTAWLALKGPEKKLDSGAVVRLEIEEPWSQATVTKVVNELAARGIQLYEPESIPDRARPREVLEGLGFQVIQDRETRRQVRNITPRDEENGSVLAEMDIDSVIYRLGEEEIRHYEVEVELKSETEAASGVIEQVRDALTKELGDGLRRWAHSKLAIGFALEKLRIKGALEGALDPGGNLKPAAYDRIDEYLKHT